MEIALLSNPAKQSKGEIFRVLSGDPEKTIVVLANGDKGRVIRMINSEDAIKKRIMAEGQHAENKESFGDGIMRHDVIPKTVQSFLNSDGGYLYIGIRDTGELPDRVVGLDHDFKIIDPEYDGTQDDKMCDTLQMRIMDALERHLESRAALGELIRIGFPTVFGTRIAEVVIKRSPRPWFFRHITKNNKEKKFEIRFNNETVDEKILDDFYIRHGNSKKRLDTHREFYDYVTGRFA